MDKRVDGKKLAERVLDGLRKDLDFPHLQRRNLLAIAVEPSEATVRFIEAKRKVAEGLGMGFSAETFPRSISAAAFAEQIHNRSHAPDVVGIIVQLPLPPHLDGAQTFNALPVAKDVDVLSEAAFHNFVFNGSSIMPPVTGAIDYICQAHKVELKGKFVAILGAGKLIGAPTLAWFAKQGAQVCSFCDSASAICSVIQQADVVVSGMGRRGFVTADMLKPGVVVFDAGFSVENGKVYGDIDRAVLEAKAGLYTPVPGGIGPLTVALIFRNALGLYKAYQKT